MFSRLFLIMLRSRLRRICRNKKLKTGHRSRKIEQLLKKHKFQAITRLYQDDPNNIDDVISMLLGPVSCTTCVHTCNDFEPILRASLDQIQGYQQLIGTVEGLRRVPYSPDNTQHEDMLLQLWERLCPHRQLKSRISKQWTEIGFQGRNPVTDFRGMGILGLHNLLFFASQYPEIARELLNHSRHQQYGYSLAIVGINMTSLAYNLLCQGHLKNYGYNMVRGPAQLHHFHNFYCYLLYEFDKFWLAEKPTDLMQFTHVKVRFEKKILQILANKDILLVNAFVKNDCFNNNSHLLNGVNSRRTTLPAHQTDICNTSFHLWV